MLAGPCGRGEYIMGNISVLDLNQSDLSILNGIKPDEWPSIEEIHKHYLNTKCCKCIKVVNNDNELLGIGTGIVFDTTAWLAHIIVSQLHQRKGIGTLIVENRIKYLKESCNIQTITLTATDQGYPVYKRIGFIEESMYIIMVKSQDNKAINNSNKNIRRASNEHYEEMLKIDRIASGENRESLLKPILHAGLVYLNGNTVQGFYLPQFGDSGVTAITDEAGIALLSERIKEDKRIYIPEENTSAYNFLIENGYKEIKRIHRMILGKPFKHKFNNCYSRIGGFAG
jgi:ribosomal protein S18 acetylase RimI-like enzyme